MIKLIIKADSLNFYWMLEDYKDFNSDEPFRICWDDLNYEIIKDEKNVKRGCTTITSKAMARYEISNINGDIGDKLELKYPGYKQEELNTKIADGLTWQGLIESDLYHYQYCYDDVTDPEKYEINDMLNLPYNEYGMAPSYISIYVPEEWLTKDVVEKYMKIYIEKFYGYTIDEIEWPKEHTSEELKKEYDEEVKRVIKWKEMYEKGEKIRIVMLPQVLSAFVDKALVEKWEIRGLKYAEKVENCDDFTLEFNDGHTELASQTSEFIEFNNDSQEALL